MSGRYGTFAITVGVAVAPDGTLAVMLQLPDGYALMSAAEALAISGALRGAAHELDDLGSQGVHADDTRDLS